MDKNYKVMFAAQRCVEIREEDIPEIADDQVLIETEVSLISTGTELTMLEANVGKDSAWRNAISYPCNPGYSNVGTIVKIGKNVDASWLGKRVLSNSRHHKYCVRKADAWLRPVPAGVSSDEATFGTLGGVAMASIRAAEIRPGDTVVVFGAGLVGQLVARLAKIAGALNVFVADVSDYRLNMLPEEDSFIKVNTMKEDILEVLDNKGKKERARIVFEVTSVGALVEKELKCLQKLGKLIITSSPKDKSVVDFEYCSEMGLTIIGAHNYAIHTPVWTPRDPWTPNADCIYFMDLLDKKEISMANLITHRASFQEAVEMYGMLMKDRTQAMGVLLDWNK